MAENPRKLIILSGKRKSGKDYIADRIVERVGKDQCAVLRLSAPIKKEFALKNNVDFDLMMGATDYKERYRTQTIAFGEAIRKKDSGYFCRIVTQEASTTNKNIWIVSDARRRTDINFFFTNYNPSIITTVRIQATDDVRIKRGFMFQKGIDDAESECDLDFYDQWDVILHNNGPDINKQLEKALPMLLPQENL